MKKPTSKSKKISYEAQKSSADLNSFSSTKLADLEDLKSLEDLPKKNGKAPVCKRKCEICGEMFLAYNHIRVICDNCGGGTSKRN